MHSLDLDHIQSLSLHEIIENICSAQEYVEHCWSMAYGWAPREAADLLNRSRLDWLVSLSHCLYEFIRPFSASAQSGKVILGYVTVGALVEGLLKVMLCVYRSDYAGSTDAYRRKESTLIEPDSLTMEQLKQFFQKAVWQKHEESWIEWVERIQRRRNAVHAFKDRDIGDEVQLHCDIRRLLEFTVNIIHSLPEPPPREVGF